MSRPRVRLFAASLGLIVAASGLGACTAASPTMTAKSYAASDGVRIEFNTALSVENLMILTAGSAADASLHGALVNNGDEPATFALTIGEGNEQLRYTVEAHSVVNLPADDDTIAGSYTPGAVTPVQIDAEGAGLREAAVPVLDGTLPPYDEHVEGH
ncbi:MAG: hypothetical protein Q4P36_03205 [Bowdeniella nasicola]|nr:hypothetical protein [Bowdeniella nasicola]